MSATDYIEASQYQAKTALVDQAASFEIVREDGEFVVMLFSDGSAVINQPETGLEQPVFNFWAWLKTGQIY